MFLGVFILSLRMVLCYFTAFTLPLQIQSLSKKEARPLAHNISLLMDIIFLGGLNNVATGYGKKYTTLLLL